MKRRQTVNALAALGIIAPAWSQTINKPRRIGYLALGKAEAEVARTTRQLYSDALKRAGWDESRNLTIERRYAEGDSSRLHGLAEELARLDVEVIMASLNSGVAAAKSATRSIPIVMLGANDPVEQGFVQSLAHPGGNITGTMVQSEAAGKSVEVAKNIAPWLNRMGIMFNPTVPGIRRVILARSQTAIALGMNVTYFEITKAEEITSALDRIAASRIELLLVSSDGVTESRMREITTFATKQKIISIGTVTLFTTVGGAIYYGSNLADIVNRGASFVDRILRGADPRDLPVEQPTKFDLILNLKTLRAIGLTVPRDVLLRADEVIE